MINSTELCELCTNQIADCLECSDDGTSWTCSSCSGGLLPSFDKSSCVTPAANCQTLDPLDPQMCTLCNTAFGLEHPSETCVDCNTVITNCD